MIPISVNNLEDLQTKYRNFVFAHWETGCNMLSCASVLAAIAYVPELFNCGELRHANVMNLVLTGGNLPSGCKIINADTICCSSISRDIQTALLIGTFVLGALCLRKEATEGKLLQRIKAYQAKI